MRNLDLAKCEAPEEWGHGKGNPCDTCISELPTASNPVKSYCIRGTGKGENVL